MDNICSVIRCCFSPVIPVNSELDLRERMPGLDEPDAKIAFLIPWSTELPLDLAGRFARNGKVFRIGKNVRLAQLFGLADVDDEQARRSPLAEYLLNHPPTRPLSVPTGRLTLKSMWTAWLSAAWGVPTQGGLALDMLLGARPQRPAPRLVRGRIDKDIWRAWQFGMNEWMKVPAIRTIAKQEAAAKDSYYGLFSVLELE